MCCFIENAVLKKSVLIRISLVWHSAPWRALGTSVQLELIISPHFFFFFFVIQLCSSCFQCLPFPFFPNKYPPPLALTIGPELESWLFRGKQLGSRPTPSWGRRLIWMSVHVYVCMLLCPSKLSCALWGWVILFIASQPCPVLPPFHIPPLYLSLAVRSSVSTRSQLLHHREFMITAHY